MVGHDNVTRKHGYPVFTQSPSVLLAQLIPLRTTCPENMNHTSLGSSIFESKTTVPLWEVEIQNGGKPHMADITRSNIKATFGLGKSFMLFNLLRAVEFHSC